MAVFNYVNEAEASNEFFNASEKTSFEVSNDLGIEIKEVINKPEELYYVGEEIIFTTTLVRAGEVQGTIKDIVLTDLVPESVKFDESGIVIVEGGNEEVVIDINEQLITIKNLILSQDNPTIIVQLTGTII